MFLKKIFAKKRAPSILYGAVIDSSNGTLVAVSTFGPALKFLSESMMDTEHVPRVAYKPEIYAALARGPYTLPELSWSGPEDRTFGKTNPDLVTEELRQRAVFAAKKVETITRAIGTVNRLRERVYTGLYFQDAIYAEKERQAREFKETHFDADMARKYPYVTHYAEESDMSLKDAAEEILLRASLDHEFLARTEKIRRALFQKIKLATTIPELAGIITSFETTGAI